MSHLQAPSVAQPRASPAWIRFRPSRSTGGYATQPGTTLWPLSPHPATLRSSATPPLYIPTPAHLNRQPARRLRRTPLSRSPLLGPRLPQISTPPHGLFPMVPAELRGAGPESGSSTGYSTVGKEPRTPAHARMPAAFFKRGPGAKSCQYAGGRGFGLERRGQAFESGENGLRLEERRRDLEHGVRKGAGPQLRVPSGALGRSSSRRGGGAASFGLLRRESHSKVRVRN